MKIIPGTLAVALLVAGAPGAASAQQDLQLSIQDGRVTLIAQNVPVSRILAEWGRIGQSTVVNGDKVVGPPVTLHFENQPEADVLGVLLRSASGYIVAPRATMMANASVFDRILIMPPSRAPAVSAVASPPTFNRQPPPVQIEPDMDEAPNDPVMPPGMQAPPNMPVTQPMPGMPQPGQQPAPMTQPRPGMPTAAPQPPGMPPGFQPNPYVIPPQQQVLPPGVRPPGVRPPGVRPPGGGDDR